MRRKLEKICTEERAACCTVPFFKCMGYGVLLTEVVLWTLAYELLLFEIIPDLFHHNFIIDLLATTVGCGLLMGTVRSLYGAFKIKNYVVPAGDSAKQVPKDPELIKSKRYCKICKIVKGDIYSHCSICNKCVFEMDHHCFFLANCVGGKNYRFFLSYVLYAFLNCTIHFVFYIPYIPDIVHFRYKVFQKVGLIKLLLCALMSLMAGLFTGFLLASHIFYITNGTSYIKDRFETQKNAYDWKRFLLCYLRCGGGSDPEIYRSYQKGFFQVFNSRNPVKALWPDFEQ